MFLKMEQVNAIKEQYQWDDFDEQAQQNIQNLIETIEHLHRTLEIERKHSQVAHRFKEMIKELMQDE